MIEPDPATWYSEEEDYCPLVSDEHPNPFVSIFGSLICCFLGHLLRLI
jgi:hypothetical protein